MQFAIQIIKPEIKTFYYKTYCGSAFINITVFCTQPSTFIHSFKGNKVLLHYFTTMKESEQRDSFNQVIVSALWSEC